MLRHSAIDAPDPLEAAWASHAEALRVLVGSADEEHATAILVSRASQSPEGHVAVVEGLLHGILVDPEMAAILFRRLQESVRDDLASASAATARVAHEKGELLTEGATRQLLWLSHQLVAVNAAGIEKVYLALLRASSTPGPLQMAHVDTLVGLFEAHRDTLARHAELVPGSVFVLLRHAAAFFNGPELDVSAQEMAALARRASALAISLLREHPTACAAIGRDLVRALQDTARLPAVAAYWHELLADAPSLGPQSLPSLLKARGSRRILVLRLSAAMEHRMLFLLNNVRRGEQKRHLKWFAKSYLSTGQSGPLVCDLIRFICCNFHPPNEILAANIVERWTVIGWLLRCINTNAYAQTAKLVLFYDWLLFKAGESVMYIEPAALYLYHSLVKYPAMTATSLEFLCLIVDAFHPPMKERFHSGVIASFQEVVSKGVIPSVAAIVQHMRIDASLTAHFSATFPAIAPRPRATEMTEDEARQSKAALADIHAAAAQAKAERLARELQDEADDDDDVDHQDQPAPQPPPAPLQAEAPLPSSLAILSAIFVELRVASGPNLHSLTVAVLDQFSTMSIADAFSTTVLSHLTLHLAPLFTVSLSLSDNQAPPPVHMHLFLRALWMSELPGAPLPAGRPHPVARDARGIALLHHISIVEPRIVLRFLLFCERCASIPDWPGGDPVDAFAALCDKAAQPLDVCLLRELVDCRAHFPDAWPALVYFIFSRYTLAAAGRATFIHHVVAHADCTLICRLVLAATCNTLSILCPGGTDTTWLSVFEASLAWEVLEQSWFWQLATAELSRSMRALADAIFTTTALLEARIADEHVIASYPEMVLGLASLLRAAPPTPDIVFRVLTLPPGLDRLPFAALVQWAQTSLPQLTICLCTLLDDCNPESPGGARLLHTLTDMGIVTLQGPPVPHVQDLFHNPALRAAILRHGAHMAVRPLAAALLKRPFDHLDPRGE
eukprot:m.179301 g.179301  ORF g.179301 m.179301 type:complete len:959 (+) comp15367_c0_seq5:64-2940(+)